MNLLHHATAKNRKTAAFVHQLTGWPTGNCLEFAVLFEWHIAQAKGADNLLRSWR